MTTAGEFPVSDMAISKANRLADAAANDYDDPALQLANLVGNGVNSFSRIAVEGEYQEFLRYDQSDFTLGVLTCAKVLVEAGVRIDEKVLEGLKERVRQISLGLSSHLEARHAGEDLRRFYLPEDGGNG